MDSTVQNPPGAEHRIVFRHRGRTVDVFDTKDGWHYMVEGDEHPSKAIASPGKAIEKGIRIAETKSRRASQPAAKATARNPKPAKTQIAAYLRSL